MWWLAGKILLVNNSLPLPRPAADQCLEMDVFSPRHKEPHGKVPKYRSSCNACNEAKVRCDQTKPTCTRCIRRKLSCVYSISRRSGKRRAARANPIPYAHTAICYPFTPNSLLPSLESIPDIDPVREGNLTASIATPTASEPCNSESQTIWSIDDADTLANSSALDGLSPDWSELPTWELDRPESSTFGIYQDRDIQTPTPGTCQERCEENGYSRSNQQCYRLLENDLLSTSFCNRSQEPSSSYMCRCHEVIILQMATLPAILHSGQTPVDVKLVQFKEAMNLCKGVIKCQSPGKDYTTMLSICTLVGRMLSVLEAVHQGRETDDRTRHCSSPVPEENRQMPSLFFGLYQADQEDEKYIHREFWRLQTKKFGNILTEFQETMLELWSRQANQDTGEMAACEELIKCLDKRTQVLRQKGNATRAGIEG